MSLCTLSWGRMENGDSALWILNLGSKVWAVLYFGKVISLCHWMMRGAAPNPAWTWQWIQVDLLQILQPRTWFLYWLSYLKHSYLCAVGCAGLLNSRNSSPWLGFPSRETSTSRPLCLRKRLTKNHLRMRCPLHGGTDWTLWLSSCYWRVCGEVLALWRRFH